MTDLGYRLIELSFEEQSRKKNPERKELVRPTLAQMQRRDQRVADALMFIVLACSVVGIFVLLIGMVAGK